MILKRILCAFLLIISTVFSANALHIKGGWIEYSYLSRDTVAKTTTYNITAYFLVTCDPSVPYPASSVQQVYIGVFDAFTNAYVSTKTIPNTSENTVSKTTYSPCLSNPPSVCFKVFNYVSTIILPDNPHGYILAIQDSRRSSGIVNINNSGTTGITVTNGVPGTINGIDYHINSSPSFVFKDTTIICHNASFLYQFSATDADGDSLSYSFNSGLDVSNANPGTSYNPPASPPYNALSYSTGYSGTQPLGPNVTIDAATGMISGTAPATTGEFVLAVYVTEWRKGVKINTVKKELQLYVNNCSLSAASLPTSILNCSNYTESFQNLSAASNITSYLWDFGVANTTKDTSTAPVATYTYADSGTYTVKLKVSNTLGCSDSAQTKVKVYPGLKANFSALGSCYQSPFIFTNLSMPGKGGSSFSYLWNFGVLGSTTDTSTAIKPSYLFTTAGTYTVKLIITSNQGCSVDTSKTIIVNDKPFIFLPFKDTLICSIDSVPLIAQSDAGASFAWSPAYNIIAPNTSNPVVYPKDTTTYTVTVSEKGCVDSATVKVNVLNFITVTLKRDDDLCKTDSITLSPISYALSYKWSPSTGLNDSTIKYPLASPNTTTTYHVIANLGKCQDNAFITIHVAPYPQVKVGNDTTICYGTTAQLSGTIKSVYYNWTPTATLSNYNTLNPIAAPLITTQYVLTVTDTSFCKKPKTDTVTVTVIQPIKVHAGNDTAIVAGEPLQLNANGVDSTYSFHWQPSSYLNNAAIANPIATISSVVDSILYVVTATSPATCSGNDTIKVVVYKTLPDIFIPTAFTPNGDGLNDVIKPTLVGITKLNYFTIYNRWGQQIFTTSTPNTGWDGKINGILQDPSSYVFMAEAIDYLGKTVVKKGTFVLIR